MRRIMVLAASMALMVAMMASAAMAQQKDCPEGQVAVSLVGGGPLECVDEEISKQERTYADVEVTPAASGGSNVYATYREDLLIGTQYGDYIVGGYGDDRLEGRGGGDWLDGGAGDDLVRGDDGDDLVDGGSGDDMVIGDDGDDYVTGYLGSDDLNGGGGSDYIYAADDTFDRVSGGPQYDVCVVDFEDMVQGCEEVYRY